MSEYMAALEARLLEHRYRYYVLDAPVLEDFVYDFIERTYASLGQELKVSTPLMDLVDWNIAFPGAHEAKARVDSDTDFHSVWLAKMKPIWSRIGLPRYMRNNETVTDKSSANPKRIQRSV